MESVHDGRAGLAKVQEQEYDLVLLDIMLPELNGIELCRRIRQFSSLPIIMLTAKDDVADRVTGLDIGADDYITKPFAIEELLARIRAILRRTQEAWDGASKLQVGNLVMDLSAHQVTRDGQTIQLTKREFDLLEYLLRNSGIVLSRDTILAAVWGYDTGSTPISWMSISGTCAARSMTRSIKSCFIPCVDLDTPSRRSKSGKYLALH